MELEKILKQSVEKTQQAAELIDQWANGDEQQMVSGRGGAYPSAKRATQAVQQQILKSVQGSFQVLTESVNEAKSYAEIATREAAALTKGRNQTARHLPFDGVVGASLAIDINPPNQLVFPRQSFHFQGALYDVQQTLTLPDPENTADKAFAVDYVFIVFDHSDPESTTLHWEIVRGYPALRLDQLDWQADPNSQGVFYTEQQTAFLLAKVVRRNTGAYHPIHNPEGCAAFTGGKHWHEISQLNPFTDNQSVIDGLTQSARPDQLTANVIAPYDVIPCYPLAEAMVAGRDTRQQAFNAVLHDPRRWSLTGTRTTLNQLQFMLDAKKQLVTQHPQLPYTLDTASIKAVQLGQHTYQVTPAAEPNRLTIIDHDLLRNSTRHFGNSTAIGGGILLYDQVPRSLMTIECEAPNQRPVNLHWDLMGSPSQPPSPEEMASHPWFTEGLPGTAVGTDIDNHPTVFNGNAQSLTLSRLPTEQGLLQVLKSTDALQWQDVTPAYAALYDKGQLTKARFEAHPETILNAGDMLMIAYHTTSTLGQPVTPDVLSHCQLVDISPVYFFGLNPRSRPTDPVYTLFNTLAEQVPTQDETPSDSVPVTLSQQTVLSFPPSLLPDEITDNPPAHLINTESTRYQLKGNRCRHAPLVNKGESLAHHTLPRHAIKCVIALYRTHSQLLLGIHYKTLKRDNNRLGDNDDIPIMPFDWALKDLNRKTVKAGSKFLVLPVKYTERF